MRATELALVTPLAIIIAIAAPRSHADTVAPPPALSASSPLTASMHCSTQDGPAVATTLAEQFKTTDVDYAELANKIDGNNDGNLSLEECQKYFLDVMAERHPGSATPEVLASVQKAMADQRAGNGTEPQPVTKDQFIAQVRTEWNTPQFGCDGLCQKVEAKFTTCRVHDASAPTFNQTLSDGATMFMHLCGVGGDKFAPFGRCVTSAVCPDMAACFEDAAKHFSSMVQVNSAQPAVPSTGVAVPANGGTTSTGKGVESPYSAHSIAQREATAFLTVFAYSFVSLFGTMLAILIFGLNAVTFGMLVAGVVMLGLSFMAFLVSVVMLVVTAPPPSA